MRTNDRQNRKPPQLVNRAEPRRRRNFPERSVANFHSGRERPGTMSWFTPPAHRIAALDAIYLSCAFGPCGSCA
jgi:hypothetical protein